MKKLLIYIIGTFVIVTTCLTTIGYADTIETTTSMTPEEIAESTANVEAAAKKAEEDKTAATKKLQEEITAKSLKETKFDVSKVLVLPDGTPSTKYFEDEEYSPIVAFILSIIEFATTIIGSIAVVLFIIAGFLFMVSQGDEQGLSKAKEVFKYAIIGIIVTFLSYLIVIFIESIFNK